jgi:hypothetical protein
VFGQIMCTEQADVRSDNSPRAGGVRSDNVHEQVGVRLGNVHRAGGCSVREFAPSRWVVGQIMCTEQVGVRLGNVHRAGE